MLSDDQIRALASQAIAAHMPDAPLVRLLVESYLNAIDEEGVRVTAVLAGDARWPRDGRVLVETLFDVSERVTGAGEARSTTVYFANEEELADDGGAEA